MIDNLFSRYENESAALYIANRNIDNMESEILRSALRQTVELQSDMMYHIYGINTWKIANYMIVEDKFFSVYKRNILTLLDSLKVKHFMIEIDGKNIVLFSNKKINTESFNVYNPNNDWKDLDILNDNIDYNIINPVSKFYRVYLNLLGLKDTDFSKKYNDNKSSMVIQLLPCSSFSGIDSVINLLCRNF